MHPPKNLDETRRPGCRPAKAPAGDVSMLRGDAWTARYARPNVSGRRYGLALFENPTQMTSVRYYAGDEITTPFTFLVNFVSHGCGLTGQVAREP